MTKTKENNRLLKDLTVAEFLEKTASGTPVPGGGSVAALGAALAASLTEMVANLTINKKGYEASETEMERLAEEARHCRDRLVKDIDRDSDAYNDVMVAFKLPKNTDDEKKKRQEAIQNALKTAASVPLRVAGNAFRILERAGKAVEGGNRNAVTDALVGAMMAKTAALSALYNVKINLTSIEDKDFVHKLSKEVKDLEIETIRIEKEILKSNNFL